MRSRIGSVVVVLLSAILLASQAFADEPNEKADVHSLIEHLDAPDFSDRERASKALTKLGTKVIKQLEDAHADEATVEVHERLAAIIKAIELQEIATDPFELATVLEKLSVEKDHKIDPVQVKQQLVKLTEILGKTTGAKPNLPVDLETLASTATPDGRLQNSLMKVDAQQIGISNDSAILASTAVEIGHARNCIIIGKIGVEVAHAHGCLILGGEFVNVSHARDCVIFSGGYLHVSHATKSVVGADKELDVSHLRDSITINSKRGDPKWPLVGNSGSLETAGIVLKIPERKNSLQAKINITGLFNEGNGLVIFRRSDQPGEFVVRTGQEIATPDGDPILGLEGWRLDFCADEFAVFRKGKETSLVRKPAGQQ